jgi:hypothetical protein
MQVGGAYRRLMALEGEALPEEEVL